MRPALLSMLAAGCYTPPDLPLLDEIPIVSSNECAPRRDVVVSCTLDGDTFDLFDCGGGAERVRMLGIDAPEIAHDPEPADCFGDEAALELRRITEGQEVTLTFDDECLDVYGRSLAYAWLGGDDAMDLLEEDDRDDFLAVGDPSEAVVLLNEWMVAKGFARVFDEAFAPVDDLRHGAGLVRAQSDAESEGAGLWGACATE